MSADPVIRCEGVGKVFRTRRRQGGTFGLVRSFFRPVVDETVALRDIDLQVGAGELVGLIGVNGAGKTTLVKALTGIVPVSSGSARLFGQDCFHLRDEHKKRLSLVMGQRSQLWWDLPPLDSFRLLQAIYDVPEPTFRERVFGHAERLGVSDRLDVQLRQLSLGQRMKMEIIGAFLHDPLVVFLDEPTIGLDLISQETIRGFLRDLNRERGAAIVLTSHDMEDIERTCDRLLILDSGRLLFDGHLVDLRQRLLGRRLVELHLDPSRADSEIALEPELASFDATLVRSSRLTLTIEVPAARSHALVERLFGLLPVRDLSVERQPLESLVREIFVRGDVGP